MLLQAWLRALWSLKCFVPVTLTRRAVGMVLASASVCWLRGHAAEVSLICLCSLADPRFPPLAGWSPFPEFCEYYPQHGLSLYSNFYSAVILV